MDPLQTTHLGTQKHSAPRSPPRTPASGSCAGGAGSRRPAAHPGPGQQQGKHNRSKIAPGLWMPAVETRLGAQKLKHSLGPCVHQLQQLAVSRSGPACRRDRPQQLQCTSLLLSDRLPPTFTRRCAMSVTRAVSRWPAGSRARLLEPSCRNCSYRCSPSSTWRPTSSRQPR